MLKSCTRFALFSAFWGSMLLNPFLLSGCTGPETLESDRVDPESVWAKYSVDFDTESQKISLFAQFRLGSESGAIIKLKDPSSVAVGGANLSVAEGGNQELGVQGNFYNLNLTGQAVLQEYVFTWTRPDSRKVINSVPVLGVPVFKKDAVAAKQSRRSVLNAALEGWNAVQENTEVTCYLESRVETAQGNEGGLPQLPPQGAQGPVQPGVGTVIGAPLPSPNPAAGSAGGPALPPTTGLKVLGFRVPFGSGCQFSGESLGQFVPGPARLRVVVEKNDIAIVGHPKGGIVGSRSTGSAALLEITE